MYSMPASNVSGRQPSSESPESMEAAPLPFSEAGLAEKVYRTPISILLYNLVEYPHDETAAGTGFFKLQNRLQELINLTAEDEQRIFLGDGPRTPDETEFFHLINLRGAMAGLFMRLLGNGNFPPAVREALQHNALEHATDDVNHAVHRSLIVSHYVHKVSPTGSEWRDGKWVDTWRHGPRILRPPLTWLLPDR